MKKHLLSSILVSALAALPLLGCSSDPAPVTQTPVADGGTGTDTGTVATTLYVRLGKKAGIAAAVDAIVKEEVKDAQIAATFADNGMPAAGHPSVAQIEACLVNQLAQAAGGTEKYPGVPADSAGWQCRDMKTAHLALGLSPALFDKFVTIAAGVLKTAGVADADIATIGSVLNSTKTDIVADKTTLYGRLGGHPGITGAVDAIVAEEVKDPTIAATFANNGTPAANHPSVDQIKACLVNQLGQAAGGPEKYPGVPAQSKGWQCRDMKTAHATLGIDSALFDKFVGIAAGVLKSAGVADTDIATIGTVLNGTKADIVTK